MSTAQHHDYDSSPALNSREICNRLCIDMLISSRKSLRNGHFLLRFRPMLLVLFGAVIGFQESWLNDANTRLIAETCKLTMTLQISLPEWNGIHINRLWPEQRTYTHMHTVTYTGGSIREGAGLREAGRVRGGRSSVWETSSQYGGRRTTDSPTVSTVFFIFTAANRYFKKKTQNYSNKFFMKYQLLQA